MAFTTSFSDTILAVDFQYSAGRHIPVMIASAGDSPEDWSGAMLPADDFPAALTDFLADRRHPVRTVCCGTGDPRSHADGPGGSARMNRWKEILEKSGGKPSKMVFSSDSEGTLLHAGIRPEDLPGNILYMDNLAALASAFLSVEKYRKRDFTDGCTVVFAGETHIQALLSYRGRITALYEQHSPLESTRLENDLKELRLNWLPMEKIQSEGGHGCLSGNLPEEAESFIPTWISGPDCQKYENCGRIHHPSGRIEFDCCFGALLALVLEDGERM